MVETYTITILAFGERERRDPFEAAFSTILAGAWIGAAIAAFIIFRFLR